MPASVRFLLGRANSGKTHAIFEELRMAMHEGRRAILLVPEQFTYETERALSKRLGGLLGIQVLSFERLAVRMTGATERPFLSAQGRRMVLRRVSYQQKGKLTAFRAVAHRAGFAARMDTLFVLCKQYCITPEMLREIADHPDSEPALSAKLRDMALLFAAVQSYMDEHFIDSEDSLNALLEALPYSMLAGADVYIDGIDQIHAQMAAILQGLMQYCGSLTISFCMDSDPSARDAALFAPERQAFDRLWAFAGGIGCKRQIRTCVNVPANKAPALVHLERNLFAQPVEAYAGEAQAIQLLSATDRTAEVEEMAERVLRLARGGMRYRDMAVIASDLSAYATIVQRAFARRGIPVFFDSRRIMQGHPAVELLLAAARVAAGGLNRTDILRIAKTGLAGVSPTEASALENECLRRGILGGKRLQEPFVQLPDNDATQEEVAMAAHVAAERARARLVPPLLRLRNALSGGENDTNAQRKTAQQTVDQSTVDRSTIHQSAVEQCTAAQLTRALYAYLVELDVQAQLSNIVQELDRQGRIALMEEHAQVWEVLMEMFSQLHAILGDAQMSRREYLEILNEALSAYQVGIIPATADQVLFGDIARTRSREVRALFVLGCNEGLFPRPRLDDELLDDAELGEMRRLGLAPWEDTQVRMQRDQLGLYRALHKATEQLTMSFAYSDGRRELTPAVILDTIRKLFPAEQEQSTSVGACGVNLCDVLPQSVHGGFSILTRNLHQGAPSYAALQAYYAAHPAYAERLRQAQAFAAEPAVPNALGEAQARRLYGSRLYTTVSRLETFQSCPFRHFVRYGIQARPRQEFVEKRMDIGNFSHMALERFMRELTQSGNAFSAITKEEASALLDRILPICLEEYENGLLVATARARMLSRFWVQAVRTTALSMCDMLQEGAFAPRYTEVRFGEGQLFPGIETGNALLSGVIDRVDMASTPEGDLVRVVDYKTGQASLQYARLADGISAQLPIYLAAARTGRGNTAIPAGLYYQPVLDPARDDDDSAVDKALRPAGMLRNEQGALCATAPDEARRKAVAKSTLLEPEELDALLRYAVRRAGEVASTLLRGRVAAQPVYTGRGTTCSYCEYQGCCRFDVRLRGCSVRRIPSCSKEEFFAKAGVVGKPVANPNGEDAQ